MTTDYFGEHQETFALLDELETLLLKRGWPVPLTPYYLVNHERMIVLMDRLRRSLQDDADERFLQIFGPEFEGGKTAVAEENRRSANNIRA